MTKGLLISDTTVEDAYRVYNLTSAVREALGDRQVSDEDLAKYEKAYALHMLADPDEKINVAYHPHYLSQAGTAQDPVWTAESTAQDPRYDIGAVRKNELDQLEAEGRVFVIAPSRVITHHRAETDVEKIGTLYRLGLHDAKHAGKKLRTYLGI